MSDEQNSETQNAIDSPGQRRLPPLLRQAWFSMNQAFRKRLADLGITPNQFTALRWLVEKDGEQITQKDLKELMASDPNTIASLLDRMQAANCIERKTLESDRRAHQIIITDKGREIFNQSRGRAVELQSQIMSTLDPDERDTFLRLLERVAKTCEAELHKISH